MQHNPAKTLASLRLIAILEGISYLTLVFVAMPLKYFWNDTSLMRPVGLLHGWLFVLFVLLLLLSHFQLRRAWQISIFCFILSFLPFGTFYADRVYFRKEVNTL
jgi:integral membrane protein